MADLPIRWPVTAESFERVRGSVSLELWQLRDAVDGRVSPGAVVTYLSLQSMARTPSRTWPGLERLGHLLRFGAGTVELHLRELEGAGWVDRVPVTGQVHVVCRATRREGPPEEPQLFSGTDEAPEPAAPKPRKKAPRKIQKMLAERPAHVVALASELLERYPHGERESGVVRKSPRAEVEDALAALFDGMAQHERERLADEIRAGCRALEATKLSKEDLRYQRGLVVWLNNHGWRDGAPERRGRHRDPRTDGGTTVGFHVGATGARAPDPDAKPVPKIDPEALARARARRASDPGDGS